MTYLLLLIVPFFIVSCTKREIKRDIQQAVWTDSGMEFVRNSKHQKTKILQTHERARQENAKFADIAVPLQAKQISYVSSGSHEEAGTLLAFETNTQSKDLEAFYQQEMESLGWNFVAIARGAETVLFFDKPTSICSVSLRLVYKSKEPKMVIVIAFNAKNRTVNDGFSL